MLAALRKRAVLPEKLSVVVAGVRVPQVSSPRGTALTRESGGNVTKPVSFTVPGTASRAVVSSTIEIEPVIVSCAPACTTVIYMVPLRLTHQPATFDRDGDRQRSTIGSRNIRNLLLR